MRKRFIPFLLLAILLSAGAVLFLWRVYNVPGAASVQRGYMDPAIKMVLSIGAVVFIWVATMLAYVLAFSRGKRGDGGYGPPVRGNQGLETAWTVIPLLMVIGVSVYGGFVLRDMTEAPAATALRVDVTAFRWGWKFDYPDYSVTSNYLELEVNRPVELHMFSLDVVHAFWVQQFGPKQDIVPGMMMHLDITPDKMGEYQVVCDQLCGAGHTNMTAPVYVVSGGEFENWAKTHQTVPTAAPTSTAVGTAGQMAQLGRAVFGTSCAKCHGSAGQGGSGPALIGSGNGLAKYNTAQALLNFMSAAMPLDTPGSLSKQYYSELLAFILVQDNYLQAGTAFDTGKLASVTLK
jgi:cytochrome c oxidase subunit II